MTIHAPFTLPVKRGCPPTSGKFSDRATLEDYCRTKYSAGWSISRISHYAGISSGTSKKILYPTDETR
jgi:hypothetical protein